MIAGIQEILLLILIVMAIILLPRMTARGRRRTPPIPARRPALPYIVGRMRLAIVLSLLWPGAMAIYLSPWDTGWKVYVMLGLGPVLFFWAMVWVIAGYKKR